MIPWENADLPQLSTFLTITNSAPCPLILSVFRCWFSSVIAFPRNIGICSIPTISIACYDLTSTAPMNLDNFKTLCSGFSIHPENQTTFFNSTTSEVGWLDRISMQKRRTRDLWLISVFRSGTLDERKSARRHLCQYACSNAESGTEASEHRPHARKCRRRELQPELREWRARTYSIHLLVNISLSVLSWATRNN